MGNHWLAKVFTLFKEESIDTFSFLKLIKEYKNIYLKIMLHRVELESKISKSRDWQDSGWKPRKTKNNLLSQKRLGHEKKEACRSRNNR